MNILPPKKLNKGDTIGVISMSHYVSDETIAKATEFIQNRGYNTYVHPQTKLRHHKQAGTIEDRLNALHDVFANPEIDAIIVTSGGNRALHLLDHIDYELIKQNPKIFCGYSDTSALLNAFHAQTGLITFHGPDLHRLTHPTEDVNQHFDIFETVANGNLFQYDMDKSQIIRQGTGEGLFVGGNLTLIQNMIKTKYLTDFKDKIVFIEDEKETLWNLDRMLLFFKRHGYFDDCAGIIFGGFSESVDYATGKTPFGYSLEDLIKEHCMSSDTDFPIITKAPFGHLGAMATFPIGAKASLSAQDNQVTLELMQVATK
ncbi:MAG: LD-carboxypeptidase [Rickettsiales bacterium]|nr:LD-carboxypeptidase [Rickettsiales bacterium]